MKAGIVVADASTLIGLSRINQLELLRELFGRVLVPEGVYDEVVEEDKPGSERVRKAKYLKVEKVNDRIGVELLLHTLGLGEAEVVVLAKEKRADLVLLDEKRARKAARRAGFNVMGVLGLLVTAKRRKLIPWVEPFVKELLNQGFRLSPKVVERALREADEG